jgi:hypothetical protein
VLIFNIVNKINMSCDISLGRIEPCKTSNGGLKSVYFVNWGDATGYTYDATDTDVIDAVAGTPSAYKYDLKGNSSFEQTITSSRENGTTFFEQTLNLTLKKLSIVDHKQIKLLAYGRPQVIVEDNNGSLFYAGLKHGMEVSGGTIVTGAAMGDLSGYTLVLTGQEPVPANFLGATLVAAGFTVVSGS